MLHVTRMTNQHDSINSLLQHGHVADNNCCVAFPALRFPYLILCPRECKWKVATASLAMRTKSNSNYKKEHRTLRSLRKNKNNNFIRLIKSFSR